MVTNGLNKITQNETQDLQLVDNFSQIFPTSIHNKDKIPSK